MKLIIKYPSRERPDVFKQTFQKYVSYLSGRHEVEFILTFDTDDNSMNNPSIRNWIDLRKGFAKINYHYGEHKTKVEAINANLQNLQGDVLLLASDDMVPEIWWYDQIIADGFAQVFPNYDGAIKFWDGNRPKEDTLMTLSIVGVPLYRHYNYIYHPSYYSLYCDNEQTDVLISLGKLAKCDQCIIHHNWNLTGTDQLQKRNSSADMYARDQAVYIQRKAKGFI